MKTSEGRSSAETIKNRPRLRRVADRLRGVAIFEPQDDMRIALIGGATRFPAERNGMPATTEPRDHVGREAERLDT